MARNEEEQGIIADAVIHSCNGMLELAAGFAEFETMHRRLEVTVSLGESPFQIAGDEHFRIELAHWLFDEDPKQTKDRLAQWLLDETKTYQLPEFVPRTE